MPLVEKMGKKKLFLPTSHTFHTMTNVDIEQGSRLNRETANDLHKKAAEMLGDNDVGPKFKMQGTLGYYDMMNIDMLNQNMIKSLKSKSWVVNLFSIFTFLTLLFGGTLFGFSFKLVGENQIGYYENEMGYYLPGSYFQFPWNKQIFHIVNVGIEHLQINDIQFTSLKNNARCVIKTINIIYNVSDPERYVNIIKDVKGLKQFLRMLEIQIMNEIIDYFKYSSPLDIQRTTYIPIILNSNLYGIVVQNMQITRPIIYNTFEDESRSTLKTPKTPEPAVEPTTPKTPGPITEPTTTPKAPEPITEPTTTSKAPEPVTEPTTTPKAPEPVTEPTTTPKAPEPVTEPTTTPKAPEPVTEPTTTPKAPEPVTEPTTTPKAPEPVTEPTTTPKAPEPVTEPTTTPKAPEPVTEPTTTPKAPEPVTELSTTTVKAPEPVTEPTTTPKAPEPVTEPTTTPKAPEPVTEPTTTPKAPEPVTEPTTTPKAPEPIMEPTKAPEPVTELSAAKVKAPEPVTEMATEAPESITTTEESITTIDAES